MKLPDWPVWDFRLKLQLVFLQLPAEAAFLIDCYPVDVAPVPDGASPRERPRGSLQDTRRSPKPPNLPFLWLQTTPPSARRSHCGSAF